MKEIFKFDFLKQLATRKSAYQKLYDNSYLLTIDINILDP